MEEILKQTDKAFAEIEKEVDDYNDKKRESAKKENEAPCSVCGKKEFILKYRDVSGKTTGQISGHFSLFGGSISGYIDGETHTDPVLCCRDCENERRIILPDYTDKETIWGNQVPYMTTYGNLEPTVGKVSAWLQGYGLEVACELSKKIYPWNDYHRFYTSNDDKFPRFSYEEFGYLGLERKYGVPGYAWQALDSSEIPKFVIIFIAVIVVMWLMFVIF